MKKIFYILTAAIVALGAMACENEGLDNIAPEANGEGLTITATVSRVTWSEDTLAPTKWETTDVITIDDKFDFTTTDGVNFVCKDKNVYSLCDGQPHVATTPLDSKNGLKGVSLKAEGEITVEGTSLTFTPASALLMFTTNETVTLNGEGLFSTGNSITIEGTGETQYVPVNAGVKNTTLSYSVNGIECKSKDISTVAGTIYDLKTLKAKRKIYVLKDTTYKYLYAYDTAETEFPLGAWPGTQLSTTETVNGKTFYVITTDVNMDGKTYNYILNNNSNKEVKALDVKLDGNKYFRPSLVEIVQCSADDMKYKIYVYNQNNNATAPHLYVWNTSDSPVAGNWPGYKMTNKSAVATQHHYYDIPKSYAGKVIKFKCSLNGANESAEWSYTVNTDYFIGYYNNSGGKGFWSLGTNTAQ